MSNRIPSLPADLTQLAILLDVDGTLLDLAPTPREVFVSHALRDTLRRLWERTNGAVAFVSGRPVNELDLIFSPLQLPAIGGHATSPSPADAIVAPCASYATAHRSDIFEGFRGTVRAIISMGLAT